MVDTSALATQLLAAVSRSHDSVGSSGSREHPRAPYQTHTGHKGRRYGDSRHASGSTTSCCRGFVRFRADSDINVGLRLVCDEHVGMRPGVRSVAGHFRVFFEAAFLLTAARMPLSSSDHLRRVAALDARGNRAADFRERQRLGNADQHRPPDSAAVRHRRLLGLPARARSGQSRAGRDDRPPAGKRRPRPDAALRRPGRPGGRADAAAGLCRCDDASALQVLPRGGRGSVPIRFSACRSSIAGCCRACSSCRRSSRASSARTTCACWSPPGRSSRPIVSEARTLGQFVAPAHQRLAALAQNLWWSWDPDTVSLFRELDPVLWRELDNNPVALLQRIPIDKLEERASRARAAQPHQLRLPPDAGVPALDAHLGRAARRRALGPARRVLLGRVRAARIAADLLRRPGHPGRRPPQERVGPRHSARRRRAVLRPGLLPSAARPATAGSTRTTSTSIIASCRFSPRWTTARRSPSRSRRAPARSSRASGSCRSAGTRSLLLDSNVEGNLPEDRELTARLYGGDERVRIRQELLLGVGGVRALAAMGITPGVAAPQRRTQRVCGARARPAADGHRGRRRVGGDPPRGRAGRVHDAHAGAGRPRPLLAGADRRAPRPAARIAGALARRVHGSRPRQCRRRPASRSA